MSNIYKILLYLGVLLFVYSCGEIDQSSAEAMKLADASGIALVSNKDKTSEIKALLSEENKVAFDTVISLEKAYQSQIKDICTKAGFDIFTTREALDKDIEEIKADSIKSKYEKMTAIKSIYQDKEQALAEERDKKLKCYYQEKAQLGPIMIEEKYLRYFCYGKKVKHGFHHKKHLGLHKSGKKFFKKKDKTEYFASAAEVLNISLASEDCKLLVNK
jgi:hypothetical protein